MYSWESLDKFSTIFKNIPAQMCTFGSCSTSNLTWCAFRRPAKRSWSISERVISVFSVPCLIYLAVLWPVSVSLPPFFAQTRSFCSFLFLQCIAYSEEAACRYLKTARTSLAAWIIPYFSFTFRIFWIILRFPFFVLNFSALSLLVFFLPLFCCSTAQIRLLIHWLCLY